MQSKFEQIENFSKRLLGMRQFWYAVLIIGIGFQILAATMMPAGLDAHLHATMVTDGMDDGEPDLEWGPTRPAETDQSTPTEVSADGRWWPWHLWMQLWFTVFGVSLTTLHLMGLATSFLSLATVYLFTRRLWNEEDALRLTAIAAAYSPLFRAAGRVYQEGAILLLVTIAFAALILGERQRKNGKIPLLWIISVIMCMMVLAMKGMPEVYVVGFILLLLTWTQKIAEKEIELNFTQTACIVVTLSILTMAFRLSQIDFPIQEYFIDIIQAWLIAWLIGGFIFIYAGMCLFIRHPENKTKLTLIQISSLVCCGVLIGWIAAIWMVEAIVLEMSFFELWPESFRHNPRYASLLLVPMWWAWMERHPGESVIQPEKAKSALLVGAILLMMILNSYHLATTGTRGMEVIGEELSDEMNDDDEILFVAPAPLAMHRLYALHLTLDPESDSNILAHWISDSTNWVEELDSCQSLQGINWILFDYRVDTELNENWTAIEMSSEIDQRWRVYQWNGIGERC
ncbi:MAG: hypothetical protein VYA86_00665 [Candidatus Thermoplasmatota archaeon]|nr:hypothetical protein [Candidatus Thermoplasmatota archaeon]